MDNTKNLTTKQPLDQTIRVVSPRNKKIGLFLLIGPIIGLLAILVIYSIITFIISSIGIKDEESRIIVQIINIFLSLIGTICTIGIMIGIPLGIIYLSKKELSAGAKYDERSGKKEASVIPEEINGWNWGAFGLTWIWGVYHGVWISLLVFLPLINIIVVIVLGIKGNEWAWRARRWESVAQFISSQKKWKPWGIAFFILGILGVFLSFINPQS